VIVHRRRSLALYLPASLRKREQEEETHRGLTTHSGPSRENKYVDCASTGETETMLDLARIDVQDVGTIRGMFHVVRADYGLDDMQNFSQVSRARENHWFYLHRFKQPNR
jgi:hypothetical protein